MHRFSFFVFFGTGFYFLFRIIHAESLLGTEGGGGAHILVNIQNAYALLGFVAIMYVLLSEKLNAKRVLMLGVLLFLVTGFKFYAGIVGLVFVGTYLIVLTIKDRRELVRYSSAGIVALGFFILSILLVYNPLSNLGKGEAVFSFAPLALAHRLIEERDRLYIPYLALARYTLMEGGLGPRLIALELFSIGVYIFFELGFRMLGFVTVGVKTFKKKDEHI